MREVQGTSLGLNQTGPLIQGVQSAPSALFAFMRFFQSRPVGASLSVCSVLGNVYGIVCPMWADPVRCHGHKDLFSLIRRECPGGKVARRHPCPVEGKEMLESGCDARGDARRTEAGTATTKRCCPVFQGDGRAPSLFMTALNILKPAWARCPPSH